MARLRVLLVADDLGDVALVMATLADARSDIDVQHVTTLRAAGEVLAVDLPDVILLDLTLPDSRGLQGLRSMLARAPDVPVIVLTGLEEESVGDAALELGAADFLSKGWTVPEVLVRSVRYAMHRLVAEARTREVEQRSLAWRTSRWTGCSSSRPATCRC